MSVEFDANGKVLGCSPSYTDEEIEEHRLETIAAIKADEAKDKDKAEKEYNADLAEDRQNLHDLYDGLSFEEYYTKDSSSELDQIDADCQYHAVGQIELLMAMAEKVMNNPVMLNNPLYYREASKAFSTLFNLQQITVSDWFEMRKKENKHSVAIED